MQRHIVSIVGGLVGGALGTAAIRNSFKHAGRIPEVIRPPAMLRDPGDYLIERIEQRRGRPLSAKLHRRSAEALAWIYGVTGPLALSALAPRLRLRRVGRALAAGAAVGAAVWAIGFLGWLPRTRLVAPVKQQGVSHHASALASHVAYGAIAALPIYAANRVAERR
jgi:hypothetical protein